MSAIANAQEFYFSMTGNYANNGEHLFELVESAMDSLIADSLFLGKQTINLSGIGYSVNMEKGLERRIDTTFSKAAELYFTYDDTIFTIGMKNPDSGGTDTLFVNVKDLEQYQADEYYKEVYGTDIVQRTEIRTDYLRNKYHLQKDMLFCPLTNKPFIFEIDTSADESIFLVKSPLNVLNEPYTESRFGIFTFEAGDHGYIKGSQKSWAE